MAKIYSTPKEVGETPNFTDYQDVQTGRFDIEKYHVANTTFIEKVQDWARVNGDKSPESGEIIRFPVADGQALYVVFKLKPASLIHLNTYDGYQFQYINRITGTDIKNEVKRTKTLVKLFGK